MASRAPARAKPVRRNELDWLRTFAVLGLIPFHAAVIFTTGSMDYVKNPETSRAADIFVSFISTWGMALIFLIAGAGARFALQVRTPSLFVRERFVRLVIPFLFGVIVIVPLQAYIGRIARSVAPPAFGQYYADHLEQLARIFTGVVPRSVLDFIGHLWFIPMLIVFEALALPLDRFFHTGIGRKLIQGIAAHGQRVVLLAGFGALFGVAHFVFRSGMVVDSASASVVNGALLTQFFLAYLFGYLIYADQRLEAAARAVGPLALLLACVTWGALETINLTLSASRPGGPLAYAAYSLLSGYTSWLWVVAILSYGMRYLTESNGVLRYLNEAAYPAYVIHMPILSLIALYVVRWDLPLLVKLVFITVTTLAATLALYDVLIRRTGFVRMIFGLKPLQSPSRGPTGVAALPANAPQRGTPPATTPLPPKADHRGIWVVVDHERPSPGAPGTRHEQDDRADDRPDAEARDTTAREA
jgi:glucan biosynthesis protein C